MGFQASRLNDKNLVSGLLYIIVGVGFAIGAVDYDLGTSSNMGSGFLPFWMGIILACLGALISAISLRKAHRVQRLEPWDIRRIVLILGSAALFGLLLSRIGLIASIAMLILMTSFASYDFRWRATLLSVLILPFAIGFFFVKVLGMSFPLWPEFMG